MYNPKDIYTEDGFFDYMMHLKNIEKGLFELINMADDLHLGIDEKSDDAFQAVQNLYDILTTTRILQEGDGEVAED